MFEPKPLAPSDALRDAVPQQKIRLGGRVLDFDGRDIVLSDALGQVRVQTARDYELEPGFLVVFDGTWTSGALADANLVWSSPAPTPAAGGEFARLVFGGIGRRLEKRSHALKIARRFFEQESFIEVETPSRVRAPNLDANIEPLAATGAWLVTSPELHLKRLIVGGMPRVYELARCHRAEELGAYHEPEFTMLEWYRAFEPVDAVMRDTETLVRAVVASLSGQTTLTHRGTKVDLALPFTRLTVAEAFTRHSGCDGLRLAEQDPEQWFRIWVERIEPALASYPQPVFVTEYPESQAALARKKPNNPRVAERFELYCAGVELCNGFGELTDAGEQRARFEQELQTRAHRGALTLPLDSKFLDSLCEGMPPCSGNALGFDRLVMLATGADSITDVQTFGWARN